jgi:hypothetical protein
LCTVRVSIKEGPGFGITETQPDINGSATAAVNAPRGNFIKPLVYLCKDSAVARSR